MVWVCASLNSPFSAAVKYEDTPHRSSLWISKTRCSWPTFTWTIRSNEQLNHASVRKTTRGLVSSLVLYIWISLFLWTCSTRSSIFGVIVSGFVDDLRVEVLEAAERACISLRRPIGVDASKLDIVLVEDGQMTKVTSQSIRVRRRRVARRWTGGKGMCIEGWSKCKDKGRHTCSFT